MACGLMQIVLGIRTVPLPKPEGNPVAILIFWFSKGLGSLLGGTTKKKIFFLEDIFIGLQILHRSARHVGKLQG